MTPCRRPAPRLASRFSALMALLLSPCAFAAPEAAPPPTGQAELSLEWIMAEPLDWVARSPVDFYFADDGKRVYFTQDRPRAEGRDLSVVELATGTLTQVEDARRGSADNETGYYSRDRRYKVWAAGGDLFLKDLQKGELRQLTRTSAAEKAPLLLLDGRLAFERDDKIFVRDLLSGLEIQAADLQLSKDPETKAEADDYLSLQQPRLFEVVRERQERKKEAERRKRERQKLDPTQPPLPFYLGEGQRLALQLLSPDGRSLLVALEPKEPNEGKADKMANFVSDDGYVEIREVRSKVGTGKPVSPTLMLLDLEKHLRFDFDPAILSQLGDDPLADLRQAAAARKAAAPKAAAVTGEETHAAEAGEAQADTGQADPAEAASGKNSKGDQSSTSPRTYELGEAAFSPDGKRAVFVLQSTDHKDRWLVAASLAEPHFTEIHHFRRRGWINWDFNEIRFLPDGSGLVFLSEETGYSQLYLHDFAKGENRRLSSGDFTVGDPIVAPDGKWVYVSANPDHPGTYGVYRAATSGNAWEGLTALGGISEFRLSPDGKQLLLRRSGKTSPPELFVQEAKVGAKARQISHTTFEKFAAHPWVEPEVVAIPSRHGAGVPIYSRYYAPRNRERRLGADGKIPAVIFIHGAGYLQNAHHGWSTYSREFFFHTWLSEHGYAVLDMDYRGSAGYGADFREAIYRHMGGPEVDDLEDGLAWLAENAGVDPRRVGLYGGSYGGFLTLMGLFTRPDTFACGAALRPVTDWAHYNHGYTSDILNTPDLDPEAYERSSPIEFAAGLEKPLLICAPMQDDNVFFQDSVRLAQKLIELEKDDWEVAIFPVEPHSFRRPSSWLDEYKRIYRLFESCLTP